MILPATCYLIALGSNQRHNIFGRPEHIISAARAALEQQGLHILKQSKTVSSRPIGPSHRRYANSAAIIETALSPVPLLNLLKRIESRFGTRKGQAWSRRVLDLDIILWSEGAFSASYPPLTIPHPMMRERPFVLQPAAEIAAKWRDPISGLTIAQIAARHSRP
ncbi:MAG: 2-amino-4-hydroxy-6-hydroxymethyldihydropteridine diphosphokinase [Parasphingorhabdus sp.]|uniref:2-amino-4-hydroxy-6- hydroxymethyldihydropteridine diphosphokinase n=1 Tax=Parasphingorhabdus sp. TaxID=2709688 RepID=UPI00329883F8